MEPTAPPRRPFGERSGESRGDSPTTNGQREGEGEKGLLKRGRGRRRGKNRRGEERGAVKFRYQFPQLQRRRRGGGARKGPNFFKSALHGKSCPLSLLLCLPVRPILFAPSAGGRNDGWRGVWSVVESAAVASRLPHSVTRREGYTAAPFRIYAATRREPFSRSAQGKKGTRRAGRVRDSFSHLIDFAPSSNDFLLMRQCHSNRRKKFHSFVFLSSNVNNTLKSYSSQYDVQIVHASSEGGKRPCARRRRRLGPEIMSRVCRRPDQGREEASRHATGRRRRLDLSLL